MTGKDLPVPMKDRGNEWLSEKSPFFTIAAIHLSLDDTTLFPKSYLNAEFSANMEPSKWWISLKSASTLPPNLCDLAETLMLLPASASAIERCFSTMNLIFHRLRSRLGIEKAAKLCFINRNIRGSHFELAFNLESDV